MSVVNIKPYLNQNYELLKLQSQQSAVLFRDDKFPADDSSISLVSSQKKPYKVFWRRPYQIVPNPKFIVDGISPSDIAQGDTGNNIRFNRRV
jgi:hypothetical protein